jgi:hypothetical protein
MNFIMTAKNLPANVKKWLQVIQFYNKIDETDVEKMVIRALCEAPYIDRSEVFNWLFSEKNLPPEKCSGIVCHAASIGHMQTLKWAQQQGVTAKDCGEGDNHAFLCAAMHGHVNVLEWLDELGAITPEICRLCKNMALRWAAMKGYVEVLKWLTKKGVTTPEDCRANNRWAIWQAGLYGHTEVLEWIEEQGAATLEDCCLHDNCILFSALSISSVSMLNWLKKRGVIGTVFVEMNEKAVNSVLRSGQTAALDWLENEKIITAEVCHKFGFLNKCRSEAFGKKQRVVQWLARRLAKKDFAEYGLGKMWEHARLKSAAAVIVLMKRRKYYLPPELWEMVKDFAEI